MDEDKNRMVQLHVKVPAKDREKLKIMAIRRGQSLCNMLVDFINEGIQREEKRRGNDGF